MFKFMSNKQARNAFFFGIIGATIGLAFIPPAYNPIMMLSDILKSFMSPKKKDDTTEKP